MSETPEGRLRARLKGIREQGPGRFMARCPAHDDSNPSLSVTIESNGTALLNDFGGCETPAVVAAMGLTMSDLFTDDGKRRDVIPLRGPDPKQRPARTLCFDYVDESGAVVHRAERIEYPLKPGQAKPDKTFKQCRPDGNGGWIYQTRGMKRVLYRLPQLVKALESNQTVYLVEGEKKADTLLAYDYPATTWSGGAKSWQDEYAERFRGADVVLLPDNDDAGRRAMEKAAAAIARNGGHPRIALIPNLPDKGDIVDFFAAGRTVDELSAIIGAATYCEPSEPPVKEAPDDSLPDPICAFDIGEPEPVAWLVEDLWTAGELGIWFGDGGSFKSSLALHVALAVAGGRKVFDRFQTPKRAVLILSEEDGQAIIKARLDAIRRGHGWPEDVLRNIYVLAMNAASLADVRWIDHLREFIEANDIGLLVCDPLSDLIRGNENDASEQRPTIQNARSLTRGGRTTVQIVHHASKKKAETRTLDRLRGTTAWNTASRVIYFVELVDDEMTVECLKLSRAAKPQKFSIRRTIEVDQENKAMWRTARFEYVTAAYAALTKAENFLLEQLEAGERMNSTQLKKAAAGSKIRMADISKALTTLSTRGRIDFEDGGRNEKRWGIASLPKDSGQAGQAGNPTLPSLPQLAYRKLDTHRELARPYKGQATLDAIGQGDDLETEDDAA